MPLSEFLTRLQLGDAKYAGEVAPGVHAFTVVQAMHRVRAYHAATLRPFAERGVLKERVLVVHVHAEADGRARLVEGFNGPEGQKFAEGVWAQLQKAEKLVPGAILKPNTGTKECPQAQR